MRLFLITAAMLSGVALMPSVPNPSRSPAPMSAAQAEGWNSIALERDAQGHYRVERR